MWPLIGPLLLALLVVPILALLLAFVSAFRDRAAIMAGANDERDFIRVRGVCAVLRYDDDGANAGHMPGMGGLTCGGHGCSGSCSRW